MDMNEYLIEKMVDERIAEMQATATRWHQSARAAVHRPLRVKLGLALIRLGHWALGPTHRPLAPRTS